MRYCLSITKAIHAINSVIPLRINPLKYSRHIFGIEDIVERQFIKNNGNRLLEIYFNTNEPPYIVRGHRANSRNYAIAAVSAADISSKEENNKMRTYRGNGISWVKNFTKILYC